MKSFKLALAITLGLRQIAEKDKAFMETLTFPYLYTGVQYLPAIQYCGNGDKFVTLFAESVDEKTLSKYDGEFSMGSKQDLKAFLKALGKATSVKPTESKPVATIKSATKKKVVLLATGTAKKAALKKKK